MKIFLILSSLFFAQSTFAETIQSTVARIERSTHANEDHLVMLDKDGQVGFLSPTQREILEVLELGEYVPTLFAITWDENHHITEVAALPKSEAPPEAPTEKQIQPRDVSETYTPTILPDQGSVLTIFSELNSQYRNNSQCYNRAEVWTYEEFRRRNLYSKKVFLFFTTKYIRDYHYRWWFHVSPFVLVNQGGSTSEQIIDYEFLRSPTDLKSWTDIFITPKTTCPSVDHYSDYSQHQEEAYCYVIKTSMYFWQPKDIEALEHGGAPKTSFPQYDVDYAYRQGFR